MRGLLYLRTALLVSALAAVPALAANGAAANGAGAADAAAGDDGVIVVTGTKSDTIASAGTKSALPLVETPQSISVIDSSEIVGLGLQNLNQALRFVAGITPEQRGSSAELYDQFKLRGFDALQYLDGLRTFDSPSGYSAQQVDVSRLDRIEVVKGPASALYGQTGPGGLIALSSKLPIDKDFYGAIAGTYANYDLYRVDVDVGGRLSPLVTWRLYGSANGSDGQQRFGKRERQTISAATTLSQGSATSFTVLANYSHDPRNGDYGVFPASGTFIRNPNGRLPTSFDGGEKDNRITREQFAITYIFDHDFGHDWHFKTSGRYQYVHSRLSLAYVDGRLVDTDPTQQTFERASYATRERLNFWTYDNQLTGKLVTGPVTHNLLFGADRQVLHSTEVYAFGSFAPINGYFPVYGTQPVPRTPNDVPNSFGGTTDYNVRQQGVYAQDEMNLGGLRVILSGRQDWARVELVGTDAEHSDKFTWRAAGLYKFGFGLAPYVSYSTSFQPQSGLVISQADIGNPAAATRNASPTLGKQIEAGAKYQVPGTQILLTAAWFRITQSNLLTGVPLSSPPVSIESGKVRSKGVEVEATAPLPYGLLARVAFSRQNVHSIDTDPATGAVTRGRILGVGRGGTSANLEWTPMGGPLRGLTIGGAVRHVDKVFAGTYFDGVTRSTRGTTLFDALARFDVGQRMPSLRGVSLALNVQNLADKKYITTCYLDYGWCWYGNRRTVQGTIGFAF